MSLARRKGVHGRGLAIRSWAVWEVPHLLGAFVMLVAALYAAAVLAAAYAVTWRPHDLMVFCILLACGGVTVEMTRRAGENAGLIKDVYGVWELPVAILLPPLYALIAPIPRILLTQWRIRRIPVYRRVFTAAAIGLSYGSASVAFHAIAGLGVGSGSRTHTTAFILAVAACGALQWAVNNCLVLPAVKGGDPTVKIRKMLLGREPIHNDVTELCVAVLVTIGVGISQLTVAFALPFVTLLQRSSRHAQLVNDSRIDSKTGLLNAGTWEREASAEVTRAIRTRTRLAVALIDIDNFKVVNDTYGHLAGDRALRAIARLLKDLLREYDLVGRFGGEEFAVLLPQTSDPDAYRIAERMRVQIGEIPIEVGDDAGSRVIQLNVSIGLASLGGRGSQLTELLAAADAALYSAKHAGRNQVCVAAGAESPRPGSKLRAPDLQPHHSGDSADD